MIRRGEVFLDDDLVVPEGETLRLEAGCVVRARPRAGARAFVFETPAFGAPAALGAPGLRRVAVFGRLEAAGEPERPVVFEAAGFGGLLLLGRGSASLRHARLGAAGGPAAVCADFARAELTGCSAEGGEGALACGGFSRVSLRGCRFSGAASAAVLADDDAVVSLSRCVLKDNRVGVEARGRSRVLLSRAEVEASGEAGAVSSGAAILRSARGTWRAQPEGVSVRQGAEAFLRGDALERNGFGVKACGGSSARLKDASFSGHAKAGLLVEEGAAARAERCRFDGDENGALVHGGGRLDADGCAFTRCRDTGVWRVPDGRARLTSTVFEGNGRDVN